MIASALACPACAGLLAQGRTVWHRVCAECTYEGSLLEPRILDQPQGAGLDEAVRHEALEGLRQANFQRLLDRLARYPASRDAKPRLLDVGCAHGWFMEAAAGRYDVAGVEPDVGVADATRARGFSVRGGFFPDVLAQDERFDVIVFNDVLEHIPDVNAALRACHAHLLPGGLVVVNAPSRTGFLYRLSKVLAAIGLPGSFNRMWQLGFPSPHVHYFDSASIQRLAQNNGFRSEAGISLPSVSVHGLYARVRYAGDVSVAKAVALTAAVSAASPLLALLPPDIEVWFLRRT